MTNFSISKSCFPLTMPIFQSKIKPDEPITMLVLTTSILSELVSTIKLCDDLRLFAKSPSRFQAEPKNILKILLFLLSIPLLITQTLVPTLPPNSQTQ